MARITIGVYQGRTVVTRRVATPGFAHAKAFTTHQDEETKSKQKEEGKGVHVHIRCCSRLDQREAAITKLILLLKVVLVAGRSDMSRCGSPPSTTVTLCGQTYTKKEE